MSRTSLLGPVLLIGCLSQDLWAQAKPAPEFQADSRLGEVYLIGATRSTADKKIVLTDEHLLISVDSARLMLRFPSRDSNTVSGENEQLMVLSGTMKNPQKEATTVPGGTPVLVRIFGSTPGQVYRLEKFLENESLQPLNVTLKPDESARYTIMLRVPAENPTLKYSLRRRDGPSRKYDFAPVVGNAESVFRAGGTNVAASARAALGQPFDLDAFDMKVVAVREVAKAGSYVRTQGKQLYAAEVQVTNRMLLPEKWGWQYCTPELKDATGKTIAWTRDMLDGLTGQTFSRNLAAGETVAVLYVFSADGGSAPGSLSLKMTATKRQVDIPLQRF